MERKKEGGRKVEGMTLIITMLVGMATTLIIGRYIGYSNGYMAGIKDTHTKFEEIYKESIKIGKEINPAKVEDK